MHIKGSFPRLLIKHLFKAALIVSIIFLLIQLSFLIGFASRHAEIHFQKNLWFIAGIVFAGYGLLANMTLFGLYVRQVEITEQQLTLIKNDTDTRSIKLENLTVVYPDFFQKNLNLNYWKLYSGDNDSAFFCVDQFSKQDQQQLRDLLNKHVV